MNALELLLERQSDSKLTTPGPTPEQLEIIKQAALRVPDHAALKPWQFILVEGDAREKLGEIYYQAALNNNADEKTLERAKELPLRAPLIIICIAKYKPHAKVPRIEQVQSAGCAVMAMQQAAFAQGLAGVWRTGSYAQDEYVKQALNLSTDDELVGFLYLGSKVNDIKKSRNIDASDFFTYL
ncbi:NAD(P)H nitroreductase [Pseudoalteromonas sp.]|uniref:NAD(P)H nitroreductase n=1 Tax=Pseudoalteromonas sp. TaxID=53249 RepID=UPI003567A493